MKLSNMYIKLLMISGSLLMSSIGQLSAMQSKQYNTAYDTLIERNYGPIWSRSAIQQATEGIEYELEHEKFDDILSKFHNKVMTFITNNKIKECSDTKLSRYATEKFLKDFIKKKIIAPKKSIEDNINYLISNINSKNEDIIFNLIIEDYTDKYIKYNQIDLQPIFNAQSNPSGNILYIVQQYNEKIYEKFRLALVSLGDYDYFENKYKNSKSEYIHIISNNILDKLTTALEKYIVSFIENNGWDAIFYKYKNSNNYINKRLMPDLFDNNIIDNNISIYTIPYSVLSKKYNNSTLQTKWNNYIDMQMMVIFYKYIGGNDSILDMACQFLDPEMKGYAMDKYTKFLENTIKEDIQNKKSLDTILSKYKNSNTKNLIKIIFDDLTKNQQSNSKKESK